MKMVEEHEELSVQEPSFSLFSSRCGIGVLCVKIPTAPTRRQFAFQWFLPYRWLAMEKVRKYLFTFRIDPGLKESAKKAALEAKLTLSRYIEDLVRRDVWRKGLLGWSEAEGGRLENG